MTFFGLPFIVCVYVGGGKSICSIYALILNCSMQNRGIVGGGHFRETFFKIRHRMYVSFDKLDRSFTDETFAAKVIEPL